MEGNHILEKNQHLWGYQVLVRQLESGYFLFSKWNKFCKLFELFRDIFATYCLNKQCTLRSVLNTRDCRTLITTVAPEIQRLKTPKDLRSFWFVVVGVRQGRGRLRATWLPRGPCYGMRSQSWMLAEWQHFVFFFNLCLMGKCLNNDDGYGNEKKEM